jgi:hypothetical protein
MFGWTTNCPGVVNLAVTLRSLHSIQLPFLFQILKGHKTLTNFDLTFNPLGEAGARSIFRSILRGVTCWVFMVRTGWVCVSLFWWHTLRVYVRLSTYANYTRLVLCLTP